MPKFREVKETDERWVQPFEDNPFRVKMRRVSEVETNRIFDKNRLYPNSNKNTMSKLSRASHEMMLLSIVGWEHPEAIPPLGDVPCDDENKARLGDIRVDYEKDGEEVAESLYGVLVREFNQEARDIEKN